MVKPKATQEKKPVGERIVFWIGSICGIILSFIAIYDKVMAPNDAMLEMSFFESSSKNIFITPSVNTALDKTEEIPLQLKIVNKGGKIAKNIKLYISHFSNIELETKYKKEIKRTWNNPNEAMSQVSLNLEDLNPGESFYIPIVVKLDFPEDFQKTILVRKNKIKRDGSFNPRTFTLNCDVSSETSNSVRTDLSITIGNLHLLQEKSPDVYWIGHGGNDVKVLKVKEDYPQD